MQATEVREASEQVIAVLMAAGRSRTTIKRHEAEGRPYDAVCENDSAVMELGDETLKQSAQEQVTVVRQNTTVEWDKEDQVRALLRSRIKRLLVKYRYPPDKQEAAILLVMDQAERLAGEVAPRPRSSFMSA